MTEKEVNDTVHTHTTKNAQGSQNRQYTMFIPAHTHTLSSCTMYLTLVCFTNTYMYKRE